MMHFCKEFVDKKLWPHKNTFLKKDYTLTEDTMRSRGDLGFLSVAVHKTLAE
jgi:hypothetical protein